MGVGDEDELEREFFPREQVEHLAAICAGVERDGLAAGAVEGEVAVHSHVLERGVEAGEAGDFDGLGTPRFVPHRGKRIGPDAQHRSDGAGGGLVPSALAQAGDGGGGDAGLRGDLLVGEFQSAHGFTDDVGGSVFEWDDGGHGKKVNCYR